MQQHKKILEAKNLVDYEKLLLDENGKTAYIEKSMSLDVGGIAKGFAADEMVKILKDNKITYGIVNLGGNIFAYGSKKTEKKQKNMDTLQRIFLITMSVRLI